MRPAFYQLEIIEGDSIRLDLTLADKAQKPVPLTGATFSAAIHSADGATTINLTVTVIDSAAGVIRVTATSAAHNAIPVGNYPWLGDENMATPGWTWSLKMTVSGTTKTIVAGTVRKYKAA